MHIRRWDHCFRIASETGWCACSNSQCFRPSNLGSLCPFTAIRAWSNRFRGNWKSTGEWSRWSESAEAVWGAGPEKRFIACGKKSPFGAEPRSAQQCSLGSPRRVPRTVRAFICCYIITIYIYIIDNFIWQRRFFNAIIVPVPLLSSLISLSAFFESLEKHQTEASRSDTMELCRDNRILAVSVAFGEVGLGRPNFSEIT